MKKVNALVGSFVIGLPLILLVLAFGPRHWPWENAAALERTRSDLSLAESRWKSHGIQDFDLTFTTNNHPCGGFSPTLLQVRYGQLVMTEEFRQREQYCDISRFLPPQAFVLIQNEIEHSNPLQSYLSIEFDSTYGFITRYQADCNDSTVMCISTFIFDDFKPIKAQ